MLILVRTDNHIRGTEELTAHVESVLRSSFDRFAGQLTRIEVYFKDVNSHKGGDTDKHCDLEARLAGLQPIAVNNEASTLDEALSGAVDKLERAIDRTIGQLSGRKGRPSFGEAS